MCVAIIDLGTNTFNLLIAELNEESFEIIHKEKRAVKLGKNGINNGRIAEDAFLRGIDAMDYYANVISKFATQKTIATATSAMRDSVNAPDFIQAVKDKTGIEIQVISGQEEAELIFHGVEKLIPNQVNDYVIMDVGGGSTEFILVHNHELHWAKSYDLGVSRLLDWLSPSDPISQADIDKLITRLNDELSEVFEKIEAQKR
jgi:exopolyphosphatase/guanosine-5'-triphosphate,3'-diphosphate pyrophosphatase